SWFFIRYADPHWHVRLRLHTKPGRARRDVQSRVERALCTALEDGLVWRVQFDTYEREVERYGGAAAIELAEQIFHADSDAVADVLKQRKSEGAERPGRLSLALLGADALLEDFGLDLPERLRYVILLRDNLAKRVNVTGKHSLQLGTAYRRQMARGGL